jgi:predicted transcriptional regulator of viral defense system
MSAIIIEITILSQTKNDFKMNKKETYSISNWIFELQKRGIITFSLDDVEKRFPNSSKYAITFSLNRLTENKSIMSVWKGFYVIIPVEYATWGVVPPVQYIDYLMKYINRKYYVALLNAAEFYGAAHQRPQQYSAVCEFPFIRDLSKKDTLVHFIITRKTIPQSWLKSFNTQYGIVMVSKPELTAADLITFQKEIGGINRACTVLYELMEVVKFGKLDKTFFDYVPTYTIQRLGYLLENELEQPKQAEILYSKAHTHGCNFQKIPLKYSKPTENCEFDKKWKIIVNEYIEIDEL